VRGKDRPGTDVVCLSHLRHVVDPASPNKNKIVIEKFGDSLLIIPNFT